MGAVPPTVPGSGPEARTCPGCHARYERVDGVWRLLTAERAAHFERFLTEYHTVRRAEGRGSGHASPYLRLPDASPEDPLAWQWRIRSRTWAYVARHVVAGLEPGALVADVGAGVGWLSHRLALAGHRPCAIDLSVDGLDGLGAARHYPGSWPRLQAEMDRLPLAGAQADLVVFNASLHYSTDYATTLREARRVVRRGGRIVVLESPVYHREASGRQMVAERHADFEARFGTSSDAVASREFLTDGELAQLAGELGWRWEIGRPWYGWRWAARPYEARLRRRREPSRFLVLTARVDDP